MTTAVITNIFIVVTLLCAQQIHAQMGPLNLDILKAERCEGFEDNEVINLEIISIDDETKGVTGYMNLPFDLDQTVSYAVVVDKIADGEVQEGVFRHGGNYFCEDIEKFVGDLWVKVADAAGLPNGCPKPKGEYKVENHPLDYNDVKLEKFLYGRFIMHIKFIRMGEEFACVSAEFTNTPPGEGTP